MMPGARTPFLHYGWPALLLIVTGCAREQDYIDVMNDQKAAWQEMTDVLKTVKDGPTMAAAKRTLEANAEKYEAISRRASALPKPPPAKVQERMKEESFFLQRTLENLQTQVQRVSKLPGGAELLNQFESTKGLLSAVQP